MMMTGMITMKIMMTIVMMMMVMMMTRVVVMPLTMVATIIKTSDTDKKQSRRFSRDKVHGSRCTCEGQSHWRLPRGSQLSKSGGDQGLSQGQAQYHHIHWEYSVFHHQPDEYHPRPMSWAYGP